MASRRPSARSGPATPMFDFDVRVLDDVPEQDPASPPTGGLDGVAYRDLVCDDWLVPVGEAIDGCRFDGLRTGTWTLRGTRLAESVIARADLPVVSAARSEARDLVITDSRLGSVEAFDASWRGIRFVRCRLGFLNLRGSNLMDVAFEDCTIDEVDLLDAKVRRLAFADCGLRSLNVTGAALTDVDLRGASLEEVIGMPGLRGATISLTQLQQMAPAFAELAGVSVR